MFCQSCGKAISDTAQVCESCGKPIPRPESVVLMQQGVLLSAKKPPWKPRVSGFIGFLFGPMAAGIVVFINMKRLGRERKANFTLGFTILGCVLLFLLADRLPLEAGQRVLKFVGNLVSPLLFPTLEYNDFKKWKSSNPQVVPCRGWKALGWGVVGIAAFFALAATVGIITSRNVEHINANIELPPTIAKGEEFTFEIHVENTAKRRQTLHSIDIGESYREGITIRSTEPPFSSSEYIPFANTRSYGFSRDIPPKTKLVVTFHATARKLGVFESDFWLCINSASSCLIGTMSTTVVTGEK